MRGKLGDEGEEGEEEEGGGEWHYLVNQPGLAWLDWVLTKMFDKRLLQSTVLSALY